MQKRNKTKLHSVMAMLFVAVLMCATLPGIKAEAASYSGSGTMADPYLVQTAEQLQGIRDNLSAHYKLANTIDLSGMDFKPIGRMNAPFTGSFVCELNADYTPKYVIKNLKISVAQSAYIGEGASKWEAALFGATNGSTFSGIYVLDAHISNDNYGDNTGNVAYGDFKPGMDDMPTAILLGYAENTTVMNCGVTGVVDASANNTGGLASTVVNSTIENCYSAASVTTIGLWQCGGLIASGRGITVNSCFATGDVSGNSHTGNFIGAASVSQPCSFSNCYATGKVLQGSVYQPTSGVSSSKIDIPTIGVVTDASKYTPETTTTTPDAQTGTQTGTQAGTQTGTQTGTQAETTTNSEDVKALIEKLPDPAVEGAVTADDKAAIKEAWKAYESMSTGDKDEFDATLYAKLSDCRYQVSLLIVADWMDAVEALPKAEDLTLDDIESINELYDDFLFIDESILKASSKYEELKDKIEAAHEYAEKNANVQQGAVIEIDNGLTSMEKVIVIVCLSLFGIIMIAQIVMIVYLVGKIKKVKSKGDVERNEQ